MPIIVPNFASNEKITAEKVNAGNELIEEHFNGNLRRSDFQEETNIYTSGGVNVILEEKVIQSDHIHPPRFYGSPSPRAEFASSDIVYRQVDHTTRNSSIMWSNCSTNWEAVPGLSTTIHAKPLLYANVIANWTVREITDDVATTNTNFVHTKRIAEYALFTKGPDDSRKVLHVGSRRFARQVGQYDNILGTQNLSICFPIHLQQGVNHVFIAQRFMTNIKRDHFKLYVFNRNMVVDINYL